VLHLLVHKAVVTADWLYGQNRLPVVDLTTVRLLLCNNNRMRSCDQARNQI